MSQFKRKIIKYFILCAFGISLIQSMIDSIFDDLLFPMYADYIGISKILISIYLVLSIVVFVLFGFVFYHLTNKAIEKESKRQVNERNILYAYITHDLKTPMTSLQGFAAALREDRIKPEEQKEIFDIIYNKSCYMNELVERIFAYSKLNTTDYQLSYSMVDLGVLVRDLVAFNYAGFESKDIELVIDIPEKTITCLLDEKEMKRAINNLIVNAYKHNESGTKVLVQVVSQGRSVYVVIADTGEMIPKEIEETLFQPFICGNEARLSGSGNGLGLTISRLIVEKHRGKLSITSHISGYKKGFVIQLPNGGGNLG